MNRPEGLEEIGNREPCEIPGCGGNCVQIIKAHHDTRDVKWCASYLDRVIFIDKYMWLFFIKFGGYFKYYKKH